MKNSESFIYEMHTHTSEVSHCGQMAASEVVKNYIDARYNGLIITDHLNNSTFEKMEDATWDEKVTFFMSGYLTALDTARKLDKDFTVLFGAELRLVNENDNDYLIYGITEEFLRNNPDIMTIHFREMAKRVHENGMLLFQAHPFREGMQISNWHLLDGIEVYNGNSSHNSNNCIADLWADRHSLIKISGSDYHGMWGMRPGGIATNTPITSNEILVDTLKSGNYKLR